MTTVSGVGTGIDYTKWMSDNQNVATTNVQTTQYVAAQQSDQFVSSNGEKCTDGKDDGKIGFFSKVGNIIKGVFNQAGNMVKSAIQHPFKTAALIGACFIPIVGPVITAGLCAYGIYSGGKQIISGIQQAESATTDAAAKEAWQNVGGGGLTVGLSVTGLKGSVKALKTQVGLGELGADGACQTFKALENLKNGEGSASQVLKTAASETVENAANTARALGEKIQSGGEKLSKLPDSVRKFADSVKDNGVIKAIKETKVYKDITQPLPSKAKSQTIIEEATQANAKIEYYDKAETIPKKVTYSDGKVIEYSRAGNPTKTTTVNGNKTITEKGNKTVETLDGDNYKIELTSNSKTGINKTKSIGLDGDQVVQGVEGKFNTNSGSGYIKNYTKSGVDTLYTYNGKFYSASELNLLQKGYVRLDASKLGTTIAKANPNTAYVAPFLNPEEN